MKYYLENCFSFLNGEVGTAIISVDEEGTKTAHTVILDNDGDYMLLDAVEEIKESDIDLAFLDEIKANNVYYA